MKIGNYIISLESQLRPTPPKIKLFGNSLATASAFAAGLIATTGNTKLALIVIAIGFVGKFLSDFFSSAEVTSQVINQPSGSPITADVIPNKDGSSTLIQ